MNKTWLFALLLLSTLVVAEDSTDSFDYLGFKSLAVKHLQFEKQYWHDFSEDSGFQAAKTYFDSRYFKGDDEAGVAWIVSCLESGQASTADGVKDVMRELMSVQDSVEVKSLSCTKNADQAQSAAKLALHSMNPVLKIKDSLANPVLTALFRLYKNKVKPSRSVYEETIDNSLLDAANQDGLPLGLALDYFAHLKYRFLVSPVLYPFYHESLLTDDDRAGIRLLASCINDNAPLGSAAAYSIRGELPPSNVLYSQPFKCLRTAGKSLSDNSDQLLKENFMRLGRAIMGTNIFLHRNYGDIPSIARDVMFSPVGGVSGAGKFQAGEKDRKEAIDEIMAIDQFVNVRVPSIRRELEWFGDQKGTGLSFKGTYKWDEERKIVLVSIFEKRWREKNKERIKADEDSKHFAEVMNEYGDCGFEQMRGFATGEGIGMVLGVAGSVPYVRAGVAAVGVAMLASMVFDSYEAGERLLEAYQKFPKQKGAIAQACNDAFGVLGGFMPGLNLGHKLGDKVPWKGWIEKIEAERVTSSGVKIEVPSKKKPASLKEEPYAAQPVTPAQAAAAPLVSRASLPNAKAELLKAAQPLFMDPPSKADKPPSVAAREEVKKAASSNNIRLTEGIVADGKKVISDLKKQAKSEQPEVSKVAVQRLDAESEKLVRRVFVAGVTSDHFVLIGQPRKGSEHPYRLVDVVERPDEVSVPQKSVDEITQFKKDVESVGVDGFRLVSYPNGLEVDTLPNILKTLREKPKLDADADFVLLRSLVHPEQVDGGGTLQAQRLSHMRAAAVEVLKQKAPAELKPLIGDDFLATVGNPSKFDGIRKKFLELRKELNSKKVEWDEASALKLLAAVDPELPSALRGFSSDSSSFILANISPEGYRRLAEKRLEGLDKESDAYKEAKERIDAEIEAVQAGNFGVFALAKLSAASENALGKPVLSKADFDYLFQRYSINKPEVLGVLGQFNEQLPHTMKEARDAYSGDGIDVVPQFLGAGSERSAFLVSAGKVNGKDVPAVIKAGKELVTAENFRKENPEYTEAEVKRRLEAHHVLTVTAADSKLLTAHLNKKFGGSSSPEAPVSAKIFNEYSDAETGFSVQVQEHTPGKAVKDLRGTEINPGKASDADLDVAAFGKGESAAIRALATAELQDGQVKSVVTLMDRENNEFSNPADGKAKTFDVSRGQLHEHPPEVGLLYELLAHDFEFGRKADFARMKKFLDGYRAAFERVLGKEKGRAEFERILKKALKKSKEYERNPGKSITDFYPKEVQNSYPHTIYTAATGSFKTAREFLHPDYLKKNPIEALPDVYKRNRKGLEKYLGESADEPGSSTIRFTSINQYENAAKYLKSGDPDATTLLGILNDYSGQMDAFIGKFDTFSSSNAAKDAAITGLLHLLSGQEKTNILAYVSHGADHGIRTMDISARMTEKWPGIRAAIKQKYGMNDAQAEALAGIVGMVHDVGYITLKPGEHKGAHSHLGAVEIRKLFSNPAVASLFDGLGLPRESVINGVVDAVQKHNWSSDNAKFKAQGQVKEGHTGFVPTDYSENPLLFVIQMADNLDFSKDRLFGFQNREWFLDGLHDIHQDRLMLDLMKERDAFGNKPDVTHPEYVKVQEEIARRVSTVFDKTIQRWGSNVDAAEVALARKEVFGSNEEGAYKPPTNVNIVDAESYTHFIGTWAVDNIDYSFNGRNFVVEVKIRNPTEIPGFNPVTGDVLHHLGGMARWMPNMEFNGHRVSDSIVFKITFPDGSVKELSAFHLRQAEYTVNEPQWREYKKSKKAQNEMACNRPLACPSGNHAEGLKSFESGDRTADPSTPEFTNPVAEAIANPKVQAPSTKGGVDVKLAGVNPAGSVEVKTQIDGFVEEKNNKRKAYEDRLNAVDAETPVSFASVGTGDVGVTESKVRIMKDLDGTLSDVAQNQGWWRQTTSDTISGVMKGLASEMVDAFGRDAFGNPDPVKLGQISLLLKKVAVSVAFEDHMSLGQIFSDHSIFHYLEDFQKFKDGYPTASSRELAMAGFVSLMHDLGYTVQGIDNNQMAFKIAGSHPLTSRAKIELNQGTGNMISHLRSLMTDGEVDNVLWAIGSHGAKVPETVGRPGGVVEIPPIFYGKAELSDPIKRLAALFSLGDDLAALKVPEVAELLAPELLKLRDLPVAQRDKMDGPAGGKGEQGTYRKENSVQADAIRDDMRRKILSVQDQYSPQAVKQMLIAVDSLGSLNFDVLISPAAIKETSYKFNEDTKTADITIEVSKPFVDLLVEKGVSKDGIYKQVSKIVGDLMRRSAGEKYLDAISTVDASGKRTVDSAKQKAYDDAVDETAKGFLSWLDNGDVSREVGGNTIHVKLVNDIAEKYDGLYTSLSTTRSTP